MALSSVVPGDLQHYDLAVHEAGRTSTDDDKRLTEHQQRLTDSTQTNMSSCGGSITADFHFGQILSDMEIQ